MRLPLDQGLPRSAVLHLKNAGIEAAHVGDRGLTTASDSKILDFGRQEGRVVVTLDADFQAAFYTDMFSARRLIACNHITRISALPG
jgi:predicted nuclease of predicted toxin-antitoxin system